MRSKPDYNKKHATTDRFGNVTAKNQNGIDAKGRPIRLNPDKYLQRLATEST